MRKWVGVSLLLLFSNLTTAALVWFPNRHCDYARAEACGLRRLQTLHGWLAPGTSEASMMRISHEQGLRVSPAGESQGGPYAGARLYRIDFPASCPASGRPYCGYLAYLRHGALVAVEDGSPCH